ncbi:hypothetical protein GCM10009429_35240 [Dyella marensis]
MFDGSLALFIATPLCDVLPSFRGGYADRMTGNDTRKITVMSCSGSHLGTLPPSRNPPSGLAQAAAGKSRSWVVPMPSSGSITGMPSSMR